MPYENKAEVGGILPQFKEHQVPSEAGRGKEEYSLRAFRGSQHLDFSLLTLKTVRE